MIPSKPAVESPWTKTWRIWTMPADTTVISSDARKHNESYQICFHNLQRFLGQMLTNWSPFLLRVLDQCNYLIRLSSRHQETVQKIQLCSTFYCHVRQDTSRKDIKIQLEQQPMGTTCYRSKEGKKAVKLSWPSGLRSPEAEHLRRARDRGVTGVATLFGLGKA